MDTDTFLAVRPKPKPHCQACERPLAERQASVEDDHFENSFMCKNAKCPMGGICLTCLMLSQWFVAQDQALGLCSSL